MYFLCPAALDNVPKMAHAHFPNPFNFLVSEKLRFEKVSLILKVCDVIFCLLAKHKIGHFFGFFEGTTTFLTPRKKLIEMADYVFCPHKK
jgi:hypothetical protein